MKFLRKTAAFFEYAALRFGVLLVDILPVSTALWLAEKAGSISWFFMRKRRRLAVSNVLRTGITDDENEARRIAKASMQSFGMVAVESLIATRLITPETQDKYVEMIVPEETAELLDDSKRSGIFVSAHIGNWEVSGHVISFWKKLVAVARRLNNPFVQDFMEKRNPRANIEIVAKHSKDRMALLRPLRTGMMLGLISDQHARSMGVKADFFGHPAQTVASPARLHLATGCPLVCGYCVRIGKMKFKMEATKPLVYEKTGDREADVLRITNDLNKHLERIIRQYPEQYLWMHRRWRDDEG
jgi:KDO2-lipid IV(A) lauroyltransferase